jgi:arylsulfatase A-like enzyme
MNMRFINRILFFVWINICHSVESTNSFLDANSTTSNTTTKEPNLLVIMTDEHNIRTIGAYRDYLHSKNQSDQTTIWGEGNIVTTPNIDKLAKEGTLFTNFYTNFPKCTPARTSFMSGRYSNEETGGNRNSVRMRASIQTWANFLTQSKNYYDTYYLGKWHLDGSSKPGIFSTLENKDVRKFGFKFNFFRWNRGHWKFAQVWNKTLNLLEYDKIFEDDSTIKSLENYYTTDFLFRKTKGQINDSLKRDKPFALMLSIPDPHAPNKVRPPYDTMFDDMKFTLPYTMRSRYQGYHPFPEFASNGRFDAIDNSTSKTDEEMSAFESKYYFQNFSMKQYYGMVKCIDDNMGELIEFLKRKGIYNDTIIVFTADHGEMLFEHGKEKKGMPYKASAAVPFIVKYPEKVIPGKVVETAYSHIDFAPTILSMMGVDYDANVFDGEDFLADLQSNEMVANDVTKTAYFKTSEWKSVASSQFKLVIGGSDNQYKPWLFDLEKDPDELVNFFDDKEYDKVKDFLMKKLKHFPGKSDILYTTPSVGSDLAIGYEIRTDLYDENR